MIIADCIRNRIENTYSEIGEVCVQLITEVQPKNSRRIRSKFRRIIKDYELYLFLLPAVVWYIIFMYGPLYGLQIAFKNFNGALVIWGSKWVGFRHFKNFYNSYLFWTLIKNTLALSVYSLLAGFPVPILLALMLNEVKNAKYKKFVQTVTCAPHFISMVVLVGIINISFSPSYGFISLGLQALGFEKQNYLVSPSAFRHIYVWSGIWQNAGWNSIIYLAALSSVDPTIHEAAVIDEHQDSVYGTLMKSMYRPWSSCLYLTATMNVGFEGISDAE